MADFAKVALHQMGQIFICDTLWDPHDAHFELTQSCISFLQLFVVLNVTEDIYILAQTCKLGFESIVSVTFFRECDQTESSSLAILVLENVTEGDRAELRE
jgi:hypothetical protein